MTVFAVDPVEHQLLADAHPRYVSPLGDRRERSVPCIVCRRPTFTLRALCPAHQISEVAPAASSDAGDVHPSHPECDVTGTSEENSAHAGGNRLGA